MKRFRSLIYGGSIISSIGGNCRAIPLSFSMVVVTKKKMSSRNAMSAIEPAFTSGVDLLAIVLLSTFLFKTTYYHRYNGYCSCNIENKQSCIYPFSATG